MAEFQLTNPPLSVTNPNGPKGLTYVYQEFPRWMHKFNEPPVRVENADEKAEKLDAGWSDLPVLKAPEKVRR